MELKLGSHLATLYCTHLLIVPYGIETTFVIYIGSDWAFSFNRTLWN